MVGEYGDRHMLVDQLLGKVGRGSAAGRIRYQSYNANTYGRSGDSSSCSSSSSSSRIVVVVITSWKVMVYAAKQRDDTTTLGEQRSAEIRQR